MRFLTTTFIALAAVVFAAGSVLADKNQELDDQRNKPWSILDMPEFANTRADVNETEPLNNTCPGEPYTLGDIYHAALTPADEDWISFQCNQGDLITVGTDSDQGSTTDTYLELWDNACANMLTFNDDGGPGLFSLISNFAAPYTGTYNVKCRGFSSSTQGLYRLIATCTPQTSTDCPVDTYKGYKLTQATPIPDEGEVVLGPMLVAEDGTVIADLVVDLAIAHTWVGDLVVTLTHVPTVGAPVSVDLLHRPGEPASTFGCSGDLVSADIFDKYYFGTGNLEVLGETSCPTSIPVHCYAVAPENPNGLLPFRGRSKAGQWFLTISDNAGGDTGTFYTFSVHVLNQGPVSIEQTSWGSIKAEYR
jgi:hypothetical protein